MQPLETVFSQINALMDSENYTEALTLCEQALTAYENSDQLHYLKALILWKRNGFWADGAVFHKEIQQALRLNPLHKEAYLLRAEMFLRMGLGEYMPLERMPFPADHYAKNALSDYNHALKIDASDPIAQRGRKRAKRILKGKPDLPEEPLPIMEIIFSQILPLIPDLPEEPLSSSANGAAEAEGPLFSSANGATEIEKEPREEFLGRQKPVFKDPNPEADKTLLRYCDWGKVDKVRGALDAGADVNTADRVTGETALMLAAKRGHANVVSLLLERGADVNRKAKNGKTAKRRWILRKNFHTLKSPNY